MDNASGIQAKERIYIIGHKNNDTDSVCAAIAYADLKSRIDKSNAFVAARPSEINNETKFVLDYFNVKAPGLLSNADGKKLILVDHNQESQRVDGAKIENIIEVLDHHNVNFASGIPIPFHAEAAGSTSTLIARKYFELKIPLTKEIAGVLLGGIVCDCVIFKSPITTDEDKKLARKLAKIAGVKDIDEFGISAFKAKSKWSDKKVDEIINTDYKEYDVGTFKYAITQVETVDPEELKARKGEIIGKIRQIKAEKSLGMVLLMVTDIVKEGCLLFAVADNDGIVEAAFSKKLKDNEMYLPGVISRKKQVIPPITAAITEKLGKK